MTAVRPDDSEGSRGPTHRDAMSAKPTPVLTAEAAARHHSFHFTIPEPEKETVWYLDAQTLMARRHRLRPGRAPVSARVSPSSAASADGARSRPLARAAGPRAAHVRFGFQLHLPQEFGSIERPGGSHCSWTMASCSGLRDSGRRSLQTSTLDTAAKRKLAKSRWPVPDRQR